MAVVSRVSLGPLSQMEQQSQKQVAPSDMAAQKLASLSSVTSPPFPRPPTPQQQQQQQQRVAAAATAASQQQTPTPMLSQLISSSPAAAAPPPDSPQTRPAAHTPQRVASPALSAELRPLVAEKGDSAATTTTTTTLDAADAAATGDVKQELADDGDSGVHMKQDSADGSGDAGMDSSRGSDGGGGGGGGGVPGKADECSGKQMASAAAESGGGKVIKTEPGGAADVKMECDAGAAVKTEEGGTPSAGGVKVEDGLPTVGGGGGGVTPTATGGATKPRMKKGNNTPCSSSSSLSPEPVCIRMYGARNAPKVRCSAT